MALFYSIPHKHVVLIKRLGKHSRVQSEGLHFRLPLIESIKKVYNWKETANKKGFQIDLSDQQTVTPKKPCWTLDGASIDADATIYWNIIDPVKAVYNTDVLPDELLYLGQLKLRVNIAKLNFEQVITERQKLNNLVQSQLTETLEEWGITVTRVDIFYKYNRIEANSRRLNRSTIQPSTN